VNNRVRANRIWQINGTPHALWRVPDFGIFPEDWHDASVSLRLDLTYPRNVLKNQRFGESGSFALITMSVAYPLLDSGQMQQLP